MPSDESLGSHHVSRSDRIKQLIRGENPHTAVRKIAEKAAGEPVLITTEDWLAGLRELDNIAVKFQMKDMLFDSYLWYDGNAFLAADLGGGLENREGRPLSRLEAAALLDGAVLGLATPVSASEVSDHE